jgi:hypothetical protein
MALTVTLVLNVVDALGANVLIYAGNEPTQRMNGAAVVPIPPRLIGCTVARGIGDLKRAKADPAPMQITLDNQDGFFDPYLTGGSANVPFWHGGTASLFIGGTTATDLLTAPRYVFGTITNGSWTMAEGIISFSVLPFLIEDLATIGGEKITAAVYPSAPANSIGQNKPVRVGDFSTADIVGENALDAICINAGSFQWLINDLPIAAPFRAYRSTAGGAFVDVTASCVFNALGGTVDCSGVAGILAADVIKVACKCAVGGGAGVSPASFHPVDVLQWLCTRLLFGSTAYIDLPTFVQAKADGEPITVRRDIQSAIAQSYEIERLAFECNYTIYLTPESKTAIQYNLPKSAAVLALDAGKMDFAQETFNFASDPDRTYANKISATFSDYNGKSHADLTELDATAVARYQGREVQTNVDFAWQYLQSAVQRQLERWIFYWVNSPNVVSVSVPFEDAADPRFNLELLDLLTINYRNLQTAPVYVRALMWDLLAASVQVKAYQTASIGLASRWGVGGYLYAPALAGAVSFTVLNCDKQILLAGFRCYIGTDTNGGFGYLMLTVTSTGFTTATPLATPQPAGAYVSMAPNLDQSQIVGIWGAPTQTVYL